VAFGGEGPQTHKMQTYIIYIERATKINVIYIYMFQIRATCFYGNVVKKQNLQQQTITHTSTIEVHGGWAGG